MARRSSGNFLDLLVATTDALAKVYAHDGMKPGVLLSRVNDSYYVSIQRFVGGMDGKLIIAKSYSNVDFATALKNASTQWLNSINSDDPIARLKALTV